MTRIPFSAPELEARLSDLASKHRVPGATVAIYAEEEGMIEAATGLANKDARIEATTDTLFQIGSITKVYTASLVMRLVDEGRIELDAPLKRYLPDLTFGDPGAERMTTRHLLAHSSGLLGDNYAEDFGRGEDAIERYVKSLSSIGQIFEPGFTMSYSNAGYVLLGYLVERITGSPYHRVLSERLLEPAGLGATVTLPEEAILHRVAVGHVPDPKGGGELAAAPRWSLPYAVAPAGSMLCTTVSDLIAFARLHLDDSRASSSTRVLSAVSMNEMRTPQVAVPDKRALAAIRAWGLGWALADWNGKTLIGHDGIALGQAAFLRFDPESRFAVGLLANEVRGAGRLYRELFGEIFRAALDVELPSLPKPADESVQLDLALYEGVYQRPELEIRLRVADEGSLSADLRPGALLGGAIPPMEGIVVRPVDETVFVFEVSETDTPAPPDFFGPAAFFGFDEGGNPGWLHFGIQAYRRRVVG